MLKHDQIAQLRQTIGNYLESQGFELVDLVCHYQGRDLSVKILADLPLGGISVSECTRLNQAIGLLLDQDNIIQDRYILEVSSPGLDRMLTTRNDFARCRDKKVKFFLKEMFNGKLEWDGLINQVTQDTVYIDVKGDILEIPLAKIHKAKQLIE